MKGTFTTRLAEQCNIIIISFGYLNAAAAGLLEENILRLQIAMYQTISKQKVEAEKNRMSKLPNQRNAETLQKYDTARKQITHNKTCARVKDTFRKHSLHLCRSFYFRRFCCCFRLLCGCRQNIDVFSGRSMILQQKKSWLSCAASH